MLYTYIITIQDFIDHLHLQVVHAEMQLRERERERSQYPVVLSLKVYLGS